MGDDAVRKMKGGKAPAADNTAELLEAEVQFFGQESTYVTVVPRKSKKITLVCRRGPI